PICLPDPRCGSLPRVDLDAVIRPRRLPAHVARHHVLEDEIRRPPERVAPAATTTTAQDDPGAGFEVDAVALQDELALPAVRSFDIGAVRPRRGTPVQPPWRAVMAIHIELHRSFG